MAALNGRIPLSSLTRIGVDAYGRVAYLADDAAASWARMTRAGMPMDISDAYRDYARQQRYWLDPPNDLGLAAVPGTSSHGWGLAVDARGACLTWLTRHGAAHGWVRTVPRERWHYEYRHARDTHAREDWLDMATKAEVQAAMSAALAPVGATLARIEAHLETRLNSNSADELNVERAVLAHLRTRLNSNSADTLNVARDIRDQEG